MASRAHSQNVHIVLRIPELTLYLCQKETERPPFLNYKPETRPNPLTPISQRFYRNKLNISMHDCGTAGIAILRLEETVLQAHSKHARQ
jgi:hypothetical protein